MRPNTPQLLIHFQAPVTLRIDMEKLELIVEPNATIAPTSVTEREVEIIYQSDRLSSR
jgi:hypothetical protein